MAAPPPAPLPALAGGGEPEAAQDVAIRHTWPPIPSPFRGKVAEGWEGER